MHLSSLAVQISRRTQNIVRRNPWGVLLHTTGSGILTMAKKTKEHPDQVALRIYKNMQDGTRGYFWGGPTYVIGIEGKIYQIADDDILTAHCGGPHRGAYLDGSWRDKVSDATWANWRRRWPDVKSPAHLYPSKSPNSDYVGIEIIPCGLGYGTPWNGLRFSEKQHVAAAALAKDIGKRHGFEAKGKRLVGHEDVQPIERHDAGGGWDPGWLRARPYIDFAWIRAHAV